MFEVSVFGSQEEGKPTTANPESGKRAGAVDTSCVTHFRHRSINRRKEQKCVTIIVFSADRHSDAHAHDSVSIPR